MSKKLSVIIPTYKRPDLLKKCIHALAAQDFNKDDFEIIVVSDGPDGETRTMLNNLRLMLPYVQYISLKTNRGPAAARNAGWQTANGKLIVFTDDDCLPATTWLSNIWRTYNADGEPAYIAFTGRVVVPLSDIPTDYEMNTAHLENADFVTANCACTREALKLVNGFDEMFTTAWREDSDLEFRLLENNIFIQRKIDAVVVHPVRKTRWGVSIKEQKKTMFNALLYKKFPQLFRKKIQASPAWNYYLIVAGVLLAISGIILDSNIALITGIVTYFLFTALFIWKRLSRTSRSFSHTTEMIITSLIVPFVSVYWTWYGAVKFRVIYY